MGAQSAGAMSRRRRAGQVQAQALIDLDSDAEDGERAPVPTAKSPPFLPRMMSGASRSDSPGCLVRSPVVVVGNRPCAVVGRLACEWRSQPGHLGVFPSSSSSGVLSCRAALGFCR